MRSAIVCTAILAAFVTQATAQEGLEAQLTGKMGVESRISEPLRNLIAVQPEYEWFMHAHTTAIPVIADGAKWIGGPSPSDENHQKFWKGKRVTISGVLERADEKIWTTTFILRAKTIVEHSNLY